MSIIKKVEDYKCPKCKKSGGDPMSSPTSLISKTSDVFTGDLAQNDHEPGYVWIEVHKCGKCETIYCQENGC